MNIIKFFDPLFLEKIENKYKTTKHEKIYTEKRLSSHLESYILATLLYKAVLEKTSMLNDTLGEASIDFIVTVVLISSITARLRATSLNQANLKSFENTTDAKNTSIAYELLIGFLSQIPYLVTDVLIRTPGVPDLDLMVLILASIFLFPQARQIFMLFWPLATLACPKTVNQPSEPLLGNEDTQERTKQKLEENVYDWVASIRLVLIIGSMFMQYHYKNDSLPSYIGLGLLTTLFLQKELPAAYIIYHEILSKEKKDIFPPGTAALITTARIDAGIATNQNNEPIQGAPTVTLDNA